MPTGGGGTGNASHASDIMGANYVNAQGVANRPYQPYTGQLVAPLNDVQNQVGGLLQQAPGMGQGAIGTGINAAAQGTQYQAPQVQAGAYNPAQAGAASANAASIDQSQLPFLQAPNGLSGLSQYMNPYTQDVTNTTLNDLNRQTQQQLVNNAQAATADNAFGGTRQAVADSLTNEAAQRTAASTLANLNNQGFNTASGLLQNNQQMGLQAGNQNLGAALSAAGQNAGFQQGAGLFNAANQQGSGLFNAGAQNTASQYNLDNALKAGYFNQSASNTAQGLNNQAAGLLGNLGNTQQGDFLAGTGALGNFGGLQQQNTQQGLDSQYQQFLQQQNYPILMQGVLNSVLSGGSPAQIANPQGQANAQNAMYGLLGNVLGGSGGAGGLLGSFGGPAAASMFSDPSAAAAASSMGLTTGGSGILGGIGSAVGGIADYLGPALMALLA
jgi:hypothetical protein